MATFTTEGIILKRRNFGEADRVVTVLTPRFGKISLIAKGVRRITSRRAGNIELLNKVKLTIYKGQRYNLNEAESIETFSHIKENLNLVTAAFHVIELVDRLIIEDQPNPVIYALVVAILQLLEKNPRQIFIRAFEVKLLNLLGFWSIEAIPNLTPEFRDLLLKLDQLSWTQINQLTISEGQAQNLEMLMRQYLEKILEANLRSVQVMKKLKS